MECRMQNRTISMVLVAGVISIFLFGGLAIAQDFSADIVSTTKGGVLTGKIFVAKEKTRMEMSQAITITRMDKNVVWILMPEQRMYMEQPLKPENVVATADKMPGEIERKLIGKETVDGKMTNKYRIVYTVGDKKETIFQWITIDSGFPVKTAAEDGLKVLLIERRKDIAEERFCGQFTNIKMVNVGGKVKYGYKEPLNLEVGTNQTRIHSPASGFSIN